MVDNTFRTAYVYIRNEFAGILCETDEGYTFSYDEEYLERENEKAKNAELTKNCREGCTGCGINVNFKEGKCFEGALCN